MRHEPEDPDCVILHRGHCLSGAATVDDSLQDAGDDRLPARDDRLVDSDVQVSEGIAVHLKFILNLMFYGI